MYSYFAGDSLITRAAFDISEGAWVQNHRTFARDRRRTEVVPAWRHSAFSQMKDIVIAAMSKAIMT
jgi:hypothetical protein